MKILHLGVLLVGGSLGYVACKFMNRAEPVVELNRAPLRQVNQKDDQRLSRIKELQNKREQEIRSKKVKSQDIAGASSLERLRAAIKSNPIPRFALFDPQGNLTNQAIREHDLSQEDSLKLQKLISDIIATTSETARRKIQPDPIRSTDGVKAFKIDPFEESIGMQFDYFTESMSKLVGREKAGDLLLSMPVDLSFGAFGRDEVLFRIKNETDSDFQQSGEKYSVEMEVRDGKSGVPKRISRFSGSQMERHYPGLFDRNLDLVVH